MTENSVGKKLVMAITGLLLVLFVVVHMFGNLTIYFGVLNSYAHHLRELPPLLWLFRLVMICAIILHIIYGVRVYLDNRAAKPEENKVVNYRKATFAGRTMIWSGLLLLGFIVYHILQFTVRVTNPAISSFLDPLGRPDVQRMVVLAFERPAIMAAYTFAMIVLFLHLSHGIESFVQTLGWNSGKTIPIMARVATVIAAVVFAGFVSIPLTAISGAVAP